MKKKLDKDVNKADCYETHRTYEEQQFDEYYNKKFKYKHVHLYLADKAVLGIVFCDAYTLGYKAAQKFYLDPLNGYKEWYNI